MNKRAQERFENDIEMGFERSRRRERNKAVAMSKEKFIEWLDKNILEAKININNFKTMKEDAYQELVKINTNTLYDLTKIKKEIEKGVFDN